MNPRPRLEKSLAAPLEKPVRWTSIDGMQAQRVACRCESVIGRGRSASKRCGVPGLPTLLCHRHQPSESVAQRTAGQKDRHSRCKARVCNQRHQAGVQRDLVSVIAQRLQRVESGGCVGSRKQQDASLDVGRWLLLAAPLK